VAEGLPELKAVSIDVGLLEHLDSMLTVACAFDWDDVGSWHSVYKHLQPATRDPNGNVFSAGSLVVHLDACGNLVVAPGRKVGLIGVENLAVIDGPEGLLVCRLDHDQHVREIAAAAEKRPGPMDRRGTAHAAPLLAIDPGHKRVGLAASTELGSVHPVGVLDAEPRDRLLKDIEQHARLRGCAKLIIGLPVNMDGSEGPSAKASRELGEALVQATGLCVEYFDERLTSHEAEGMLAGLGLTRRQRKARVDAIAAARILQGYLDQRKQDETGT
jgi:putative Holliday junction resolvase